MVVLCPRKIATLVVAWSSTWNNAVLQVFKEKPPQHTDMCFVSQGGSVSGQQAGSTCISGGNRGLLTLEEAALHGEKMVSIVTSGLATESAAQAV